MWWTINGKKLHPVKRLNLVALLAALFPFTLSGKGRVTFSGLQALYTNSEQVRVENVVLTDTATVVDFTVEAKPYSWIKMAPAIYLSDEKGVRYPVRHGVGMEVGEKFYLPKSGKASFCLVFEPMPKGTRIFDLIEGYGQSARRWYGLHESSEAPRFPVAEESATDEFEPGRLFQKGKAVVRGQIEAYDPRCAFGFVTVNPEVFGDARQETPSATIDADGSFTLQMDLDYPVLGQLCFSTFEIPMFVRPGDTLDVKIFRSNHAATRAEYKSSNPAGCHENLLRCDIRPVYAEWERMGQGWERLPDEAFIDMVDDIWEKGAKVCDYAAWKFKLTPAETCLLKNEQRLAVLRNQLVLANWMLAGRTAQPVLEGEQLLEFYTGNDYSLYKILGKLAQVDDPALSVSSLFPEMLRQLGDLKAVTDASTVGYMTTSGEGVPALVRRMDSLRVEALCDVMGTDDVPFLVQAYLVGEMANLPGTSTAEERKKVVEQRLAYLTEPYLRERIWEVDSIHARRLGGNYRPEGDVCDALRPILDAYKGKYVQIVWLSPDAKGRKWVEERLVNLIPDFNGNPDLQFVFLFDEYAGDKEEFERFVAECLPEADCRLLGLKEGAILRRHFRHTAGVREITINRRGEVVEWGLRTENETAFRRNWRNMLKNESTN